LPFNDIAGTVESLVLLTEPAGIVVPQVPAPDVTSPVKAGIWVQANDPAKLGSEIGVLEAAVIRPLPLTVNVGTDVEVPQFPVLELTVDRAVTQLLADITSPVRFKAVHGLDMPPVLLIVIF
jgi:hypothetical protein